MAPADLAVQYDLAPLYTAGTNGTGQSVAVVGDSNIDVAVVNGFRSIFGLPVNPPQVIIDGSDPGIGGVNNPSPNGGSTEAYLDVEWAGATAPNATIYLVIAQDTSTESGLYLAAEHAVYSNIAPVISYSFGLCEQYLGANNAFFNSLWEQAAAQGITVVVATGDTGSSGCDSNEFAVSGVGVNGMASTPYNVAVGGTDFYYSSWANLAAADAQLATYWNQSTTAPTTASLKGYVPEQPWNNSQYGLNILLPASGYSQVTGGGGGASSCAFGSGTAASGGWATCNTTGGGYAKPAWQAGTGVPADSARDIPDVSLFASQGSNYSYYPACANDGDCQSVTSGSVQVTEVGGTSVATAAFAGVMALVNQKYGRQGQADNVLYALKAQYPSTGTNPPFHDITNGTNTQPCNFTTTTVGTTGGPSSYAPVNCIAVANPIVVNDPAYGSATVGELGTGTTADYNATAGYNLATGLGSIDANVLITDWPNVKFTATTTTLTPSSTAFTHGTAIIISGTVTGTTPTGEVALMTDSTTPMQEGLTNFTVTSGAYSSSTVIDLPGGTYNIWGQYSGDNKNAPSTSTKTAVTVTPESSILSLGVTEVGSSAPTTAIPYGVTMSAAAQVIGSSCSTVTCVHPTIPTGTVNILDNTTTTVSTVPVDLAGTAQYRAPFAIGSHSVTASYSGDASYGASTSSVYGGNAASYAFTVVKDTPTVLLSINGSTTGTAEIIAGQPTVLTIQVINSSASSSAALAPTGTVTVTGPTGFTTVVSPALVPAVYSLSMATEGVATISLPTGSPAGTYTATYAGDTNYVTNTGTIAPTANTGVLKSSTITVTTPNPATTSPFAVISVTGAVSDASGTGTLPPTGTVEIYSSGQSLGGVFLTAPTSGTTTPYALSFNSQLLGNGANLITLVYSGDTVYQPSTTTLTLSNPLSDFTLTAQTPTVHFLAGANATDTVYLSSTNHFAGAVTLACTAATGVTCTPSAPSVTLTSGGNGSAVLTIAAPAATAAGTYNVQLTGTDPTGNNIHTLGIQALVSQPLTITTAAALPTGYVGAAYSQTLAASGGSGGGYTWAVTAGSTNLAAVGLSLSTAGVLTGATPIAGGPESFTATVTDSFKNTASLAFTVTVNPGVSITTLAALPEAYVGTAYVPTLIATGGSGTGYTWTVTSGAPSLTAVGMSLTGTGAFSGTPTATGTASFTAKVTDSANNTASLAFTLTIGPKLGITSPATLTTGYVGINYSNTLTATGGTGTGYTFSIAAGGPSLTAIGLSLSSAGVISGTTPIAGIASFSVTVTDTASNTATGNFTLTINPALAITTLPALPTGYGGIAYTQTLAATGGSGTGYTWTVTAGGPSLTATGLSLSSAGVLSGASPIAGTASFTAKVTDSASNSVSVNFTAIINPALAITTAATLPNGYPGTAYTQTLVATGGTGTGYTWAVTSGGSSLTALGLSLSSAGVLSGASPTVGSASFTAQVTDSASHTASVTFSVTVTATLSITTPVALPTGFPGNCLYADFGSPGRFGFGLHLDSYCRRPQPHGRRSDPHQCRRVVRPLADSRQRELHCPGD